MFNVEDFLRQSPAAAAWEKIGIHHHHGIDLPLFSLRSSQSCGIGEYNDLFPIIDWAKSLGLDVIQLLPLNDAGPDKSPYSALSAFALNPLYLSLHALPFLDRFPDLQSELIPMRELNHSQRINYPLVQEKKEAFLQRYFSKASPIIMQEAEYPQFVQRYSFWLQDYALFKSLKETTQWKRWEEWPPDLSSPDQEKKRALYIEFEKAMAFHIFLQYLCFQQFQKVKDYANQQGLFLKGDIPILISYESADVWGTRDLFLTEFCAGAPPDMYSDDGQNWGFPLYDWESHQRQDFAWWKQRLEVASHLYDIYRLDHVVGFFRIWAIPRGHLGKDGAFTPKEKEVWIKQGETILNMMLKCCPLLPIAEDLGVVPEEVRESLLEMGICGTKVMRWERRWKEKKHPFIKESDYPPVSMTTVSTHDSETLTLWWKNQHEEAREYATFKGWKYDPQISKDQIFQILKTSHHTTSLFHLNLLNEYLALIPGMTWDNPEDERINDPGDHPEKNWTYRFRPSVEELVNSRELAATILSLTP